MAASPTEGETPISRVTTSNGDPAWLVTGYELVRELFGDPRLGRSHPDPQRASRVSASVMGRPVGDPDTEQADHARMRRVLSGAFAARRMTALRPRVQAHVDGLLDRLLALTPPVDFHEAFSFPLPALVISELLGVPGADRDTFHAWCEDMAHMTDPARSEAGIRRLRGYLGGLVEDRRRHPAPDVLSDLGAAEGLTEEEVVGCATTLLFAGHVTTAMAIDKGIALLDTHPEQREALWRDPSLVPAAVEEMLRAPFPDQDDGTWRAGGTPRYAATEITVAGVTVGAGDLVLLGRPAANQDPQVFPDPQRFDIRRSGRPHLAFGHGSHFCLGAPLARVELQVVFETVPRRVPTLRLAVPAGQLRRRTDLMFGKLVDLPVTW